MLNFTTQERQAIIFIFSLALAGAFLIVLVKKLPAAGAVISVPEDMAKIDLNTARKELLMRVPGVGKRLAQKIIAYRDARAGFTSLGQLENIEGVTEAKYEKIKGYLTVR